MLRWKSGRDGGSAGVAALEFALAMPVLMVSLFGTVEFGRAFWIRQALVGAAGEAARVGSQSSCPRPTEAQVLEAGYATLASAGLAPGLATFTLSNTGGASGTDLTVDVRYGAEFPVLSKLLGMASLGDGVLDLSAHVAAENE